MDDLSGDLSPDSGRERWGALFADLEGQFDTELRREADSEIVDRIRHEIGQLPLTDRMRASQGLRIRLGLRGPGMLAGTIDDVGPDWILVGDDTGGVVVSAASILWVEGLRGVGRIVEGPAWALPDLRRVVRELAQSRAPVTVELVEGPAVQGTFAGVFADHADLACHPPEVLPRPDAVTATRSIPFSVLATIRRLR